MRYIVGLIVLCLIISCGQDEEDNRSIVVVTDNANQPVVPKQINQVLNGTWVSDKNIKVIFNDHILKINTDKAPVYNKFVFNSDYIIGKTYIIEWAIETFTFELQFESENQIKLRDNYGTCGFLCQNYDIKDEIIFTK